MVRMRIPFRMAVLSAIPLAAISAQAQENSNSAPNLEEVVVTATGRSTASSTTKTTAPIIELPQSISVISREEIDLRAAATIADALSYSAGVQPEPSGIDSRTDEVSVRGFGAGGFSSNNNFIDGLRLPSGGQFSRFGFDPFGLQQIEVLKGPSSALYGQTAPGGIVNIVTKRPTEQFQSELLLQGQAYTELDNWSRRISGDVSGSLGADDRLYGRLVGLAHHGGTQVNDVDNSRYYLSPSLTWEPREDTRWTILSQYQRDEGGATYQFLPATGAYNPTNGRFIENDANIGEPEWNDFERSQYLLASFFEHDFGPALTLRNNARLTHIDTMYRNTVLSGDTITDCAAASLGPECIDGQTIGRRAIQAHGESDGFAIDTQLEARFDTGKVSHILLGGVDYFDTEWEHFRDVVSLPGLPFGQVDRLYNVLDPEPRGIEGYRENLGPQIYGASTILQTGVYLQDQMSAGEWRVTIGGRHDRTEDDSRNLLTDSSFDTDADELTWRVGAVRLYENGIAPYVSYSESFLPQVVDPSQTLGGVLFKPTTGQQYEAGIRYQGGSNVYVTFGAFEITQQNVPTPDPNGTQCGRITCRVQTGEARVRGIEFESRASLSSGTTVIASLSHLDAEVTESNDPIVGNSLPAVPDYLTSLFVDHRFEAGPLTGLGLGGGLRYTGESFGDTNNHFPIDDYALVDVFLRYDFSDARAAFGNMSLSLNARNVSNKRYIVTCSTSASCFYGQGRVVTARMQYSW